MLARNFLTADKLRLDPAHHAALIKLLSMMERGDLTYVPSCERLGKVYQDLAAPGELGFNMSVWSCGTVCCIGGWMERLSGVQFDPDFSLQTPLNDLFCAPEYYSVGLEDITVEQAAAALRNYLTTGAARWEEVLLCNQ